MNRKKALVTLAIIEGIVNILLIVLFVMQKMNLMGFIISFGTVTLLTMLGIFIIIQKTQ